MTKNDKYKELQEGYKVPFVEKIVRKLTGQEFTHPPPKICPHCGMPNPRHYDKCQRCGGDISFFY